MRMKITPNQLEKYALAEKWEPVDNAFSEASQKELKSLIPFARKELGSSEGNLQDLGATIMQKYAGSISKSDISLLYKTIEKPGNPYARFRAAFALWTHSERTHEIKKVLEEAKKDKDVAEIAKQLLNYKSK